MDGRNKTGRFGVPTSPWAERYGLMDRNGIDLLKEDPILHSGLAPVLPSLPPRYYDKLPRRTEFEIANTFKEIDSILVTEECQRIFYQGLVSWNVAPFNSVLSWDGAPPFPGGHRPSDLLQERDLLKKYHQERIEVDEDSWLPLFKKDRWYNLTLPDKGNLIENEDGSTWYVNEWSVDDERIWKHLRFILEIANRMLFAMIRDRHPWLEMLLHGRIYLWYELFGDVENREQHRQQNQDRRILLPFDHELHYSGLKNRALPTRIDRSTAERIAFVNTLLQDTTCSFVPSVSPVRGETNQMRVDSDYRVLVRLNVRGLTLLCGGTLSVAERCILYPRLAMTVLHELMHAIHMNRLITQNNLSDEMIRELNDPEMPSNRKWREPFVNHEPIAELGRSLEASVWGGTPWERPDLPDEVSRAIPIVMSFVKYPSRQGISGLNTQTDRQDSSMQRDAPITTYFVPTALLWRLQSKAFWHAPVDGKTAFRFPHLFTGVMQLKSRSPTNDYEAIVVDPDAAGDLKFSDVIARWNEQVQLWATRRPWYSEAHAMWRKSIWGLSMERIVIERYIAAFKLRDELVCGREAMYLQISLPYLNVKNVPDDDERYLPKRDSREGPHGWLLHCLGTLMLAALPMRKDDQTVGGAPYRAVLRRSAGMLTRFTLELVIPAVPDRSINRKRNEFFSRTSDQGFVKDFGRLELVEQVSHLMVHVGKERGCYIPLGWFESIWGLIFYMRKMMNKEDFKEEDWLPAFPFKIPPYEPNTFQRWNNDGIGWEEVRPLADPDSPSKFTMEHVTFS